MNSTDPVEHERLYNEIRDIEHAGDEITNKTYAQLNKSFITPFDTGRYSRANSAY